MVESKLSQILGGFCDGVFDATEDAVAGGVEHLDFDCVAEAHEGCGGNAVLDGF